MSFKPPKLPPPPPIPNAEDAAARAAREMEARRVKTGRRSISMTLGGANPINNTAAITMAPGRNTVTGG